MLSKAATIAACFAMTSAWMYDRCDPLGPAGWAAGAPICGGREQSPINLCGAVPIPRRPQQPGRNIFRDYTIYGQNYNVLHNATLQNTGHTVQFAEGPAIPVLRIPKLHALVGRDMPDSVPNPEWVFAQMHVHFGREFQANEGSEHTVDGRRYPGEFHLVHFNRARGVDFNSALASGARDAVLVVGVFLELGDWESNLIKQFAGIAPNLHPPVPNPPAFFPGLVALSDVFTPMDTFYTYAGSLTTPGCFEQVTWVVMRTPKTITPESLERLKMVMENEREPISAMGNYRPVQPLGARTIFTSGAPRTMCQPFPIPEPCYDCAPPPRRQDRAEADLALEAPQSLSTWMWIAGIAIPSTLAVLGVAAYFFVRRTQRVQTETVTHVELLEAE